MIGNSYKYTPELKQKLCKLLREGNFVKTACDAVGISTPTYYLWQKESEEGNPTFKDFAHDVKKAIADAETEVVGILKQLALGDEEDPPDFRAIQFYLTRRHPHWNENKRIEIEVNDKMEEIFDKIQGVLPEEYYNAVLSTLGEMDEEDE